MKQEPPWCPNCGRPCRNKWDVRAIELYGSCQRCGWEQQTGKRWEEACRVARGAGEKRGRAA